MRNIILIRFRWLSDEKLKLRDKHTETGMESQSIKDSTESEKPGDIHVLKKKILTLHGFLDDKVDAARCSSSESDRSECHAQRFTQQIQDLR